MTGDLPVIEREIDLAIRTQDGWEIRGSVEADPDGSFRVERLPPGRWRLAGTSLVYTDRVCRPVEVEVADGAKVTGVELVWRKRGGVEVELRTPSGVPFTGTVSGMIVPAEGEGGPRILYLRPDDQGRANLPALPVGKWVLQVLGGPDKIRDIEIEVTEAPDRAITIVLWD